MNKLSNFFSYFTTPAGIGIYMLLFLVLFWWHMRSEGKIFRTGIAPVVVGTRVDLDTLTLDFNAIVRDIEMLKQYEKQRIRDAK